MVAYCRACGSYNLRLSHLHVLDVLLLLRLRYPVRCRSCRLRSLITLDKVLAVHSEAKARQREEEQRQKLGEASGL